MYETIETIDAYLNSKHISGKTDSLNREKPFFDIVTATTNIWYRATDTDRKNIRVYSDISSQMGLAFVANVHLQEWMQRENFGMFLNLWGRSLARYGSSVVKFVTQGGRLIPSVIPWNRLVVDPVDFDALPVIEKLYFTPAQLMQQKGYDKEVVKSLLESTQERENLEGQDLDTMSKFIEVYEVHGELPIALLKKNPKEEDWNIYRQQMHVVSYTKGEDDKYKDFCLYKGPEEKNPYMITHLIKEDGRTLARGAVEYLLESQWMVNHTAKQQKDYLDLASRMIFQTADGKFLGRNVLKNIEVGDFLIHKENMPVTQVNNSAMNVSAIQAFGAQWQNLSKELSSTPDSLRGVTPPSGVALGTVQITTSQGLSLFEIMLENKGLAIEQMLRTYVIPHIMTKMDTSEEISATLDDQGISEIDAMYVPREAIRRYNKKYLNSLLDGQIPQQFNPQEEQQNVQQELNQLGNKRFFKPSDVSSKTWKQALKDFEWKVKVEVTDEMMDKQAVLTTLSSVFQTIASNPAILQDPNARMVFGKIMNTTGAISPMQLSTAQSQQLQTPLNGGGQAQLSELAK